MKSDFMKDHNRDVISREDWNDAPEPECDFDVAKTYISEGTEKKQDDANKALLKALKEFRDSVVSFAESEGILLSEAEGAAKEWFMEKWDEIFEGEEQ